MEKFIKDENKQRTNEVLYMPIEIDINGTLWLFDARDCSWTKVSENEISDAPKKRGKKKKGETTNE